VNWLAVAGISKRIAVGKGMCLASYLVFWGPATSLLVLHLLNNNPFHEAASVSIANCMGVLMVWELLLALFLFVFGKSIGTADLSYLEVQDIC
jgi:hypothetical protein